MENVADSIVAVGTDIAECHRIGGMIERHGDTFLTRVFTPREVEYCHRRRDFVLRFAGRWAAKEAVLKALGTGWVAGITWQDVEVVNASSGEPCVTLTGGAATAAARRGITHIHLSLSHCDSHAIAVAVAVRAHVARYGSCQGGEKIALATP